MTDKTIIAISCNAVALACVAGAIALLVLKLDGWGWLLFIAVLFGQKVRGNV